MVKYATVYVPTKKLKDYKPFFKIEKDKDIDDCFYLVKEVELDQGTKIWERSILNFEKNYNSSNSKSQQMFEEAGFVFEYKLDSDQSSSYKLVVNDVAKDFLKKGQLNIAVFGEDMQEMVLITADGSCYGDTDTICSASQQVRDIIDELVGKKLLKKKKINVGKKQI